MYSLTLPLLAALPFAFAQYGGGGGGGGSGGSATTTTAASGSSSSTAAAPANVQTVTVGMNGAFAFSPDSVMAPVGSFVEYVFYGPTHSMVQASFDNPCNPVNSSAIYSGPMTTSGSGPNSNVFLVQINDTNPVWYYCGFPGHCELGMAGVINPPTNNATQSIANFQAAAKMASGTGTAPANVQGGIVEAMSAVVAGGSSTSSSAAAASSTSASAKSGAVSDMDGRFQWFGMGLATVVAWGVGMLI